MSFDSNRFFEVLTEAINARRPFVESMHTMINWCGTHAPHDDWITINKLDFSSDLPVSQKWIVDAIKKAKCKFDIKALTFGLTEMANSKDEEYAQLELGLYGNFDSKDAERKWIWENPRSFPEKIHLKVPTLKKAGILFNREDGEGAGNDGNFMFCISYATILAIELSDSKLYSLLQAKSPVGILAGWNSGDMIHPGSVGPAGFIRNTESMI